jgi:hypothetical protein
MKLRKTKPNEENNNKNNIEMNLNNNKVIDININNNNNKRCLSPKKNGLIGKHLSTFGTKSSVLVELSPNINYGKCDQKLLLTKRMRFSPIDNKFFYHKLIQLNDDFIPKTIHEFVRYLDLISFDDLKNKPLSRLLSRYPLRYNSSVSLRPKIGQKVEINSIELSSILRKTVFKNVENLSERDIESKVNEYESYCNNEDINSYGFNNKSDGFIANDVKKQINGLNMNNKNEIKDRFCILSVPKLQFCPNCKDLLFNRSQKNRKKRKFHSCLKGRINNEISFAIKKMCL